MKKISQKQKVLNWLQTGKPLTPIQALERFGSFRLGALIHKLRNEGYSITTTLISLQNIGLLNEKRG